MTKQSLKKENFALVLVGGEERRTVLSALQDAGWIEFRVDEFLKKFSEEGLLKWLSLFPSVLQSSPILYGKRREKKGQGDKFSLFRIGTVRWQKEHQDKGLNITEKKRLEIYRKIVDYVDYVDVEIKSRIAEEVIRYTRWKKKKIIASYHNFSRTPSYENLKKIYREGIGLKPDIIKIATVVRSKGELFTLMSFTYHYADRFPLVITPMDVSVTERLMPLYFGSLFTYVSLEKQTASGQISYRKIACLLDNESVL